MTSRLGEMWLEQHAQLLGKVVRVTLNEERHVVRQGRLLGFSDFGTFELEDEDGDVWHGWPMLNAELAE